MKESFATEMLLQVSVCSSESLLKLYYRDFDYDIGSSFMRDKPEDYTEEELTFYRSEEDFREFLKELKEYQE